MTIQKEHITPQMILDTAAWCQSEDELRDVLRQAAAALTAALSAAPAVGVEEWHTKRAAEERASGREQNAIAYERFGAASVRHWKRQCQYLLDVLDGHGFQETDMSEEDEIAIAGIRSALDATEGKDNG